MSKPWEEELAKLWSFATQGKRKIFTYPLLIIFIIFPSIGGIFNSYKEAWRAISSAVSPQKTVASKAESDLFNEWIIVTGYAQTEQSAKDLLEKIHDAYMNSGHINYKGEAIWRNDIFYARHPTEKEVWIVAIDALSGEATKETVETELGILMEHAFRDRESRNTFGHYLYGSKVEYYSKQDFIKTHGQLVGE